MTRKGHVDSLSIGVHTSRSDLIDGTVDGKVTRKFHTYKDIGGDEIEVTGSVTHDQLIKEQVKLTAAKIVGKDIDVIDCKKCGKARVRTGTKYCDVCLSNQDARISIRVMSDTLHFLKLEALKRRITVRQMVLNALKEYGVDTGEEEKDVKE